MTPDPTWAADLSANSGWRISLLQATHRSGQGAVDVRDAWVDRADNPSKIEHIFSFDEDDELSATTPEIVTSGIMNPKMSPRVSAVRNWNAAAERSTGDLLIVIADDLLPCPHWDTDVIQSISTLDPVLEAFVLKIRDHSFARDSTLRHPIVSRDYYSRFGLWDPAYDGHGVDNAFTLEAHKRGRVIDCRHVRFQHLHPTQGAESSVSHHAMKSSDHGSRIFFSRTPRWRRHLFRTYVSPTQGRTSLRMRQVKAASIMARAGYVWGILPTSIQNYVSGCVRRYPTPREN